MSAQPNIYIYEEDYLKMERTSPFKNEYYKGAMYALGGASFRYNVTISNLSTEISPFLQHKKYKPFFNDLRVYEPKFQFYAYPDMVILCDTPKFPDEVKDTILNPAVLIEVLSKSTEQYDKSVKLGMYRAARTFKEYILIYQDRPFIECFYKVDDFNWTQGGFKGLEAKIQIKTIDLDLNLANIYADINFDFQFDIAK